MAAAEIELKSPLNFRLFEARGDFWRDEAGIM